MLSIQYVIQHIVADVLCSVCLLVSTVSCARTAELIEVPFGICTWVGLRNHILGGGLDPPGEGAIFGYISKPAVKHREVTWYVASAMQPFAVITAATCLIIHRVTVT